MKMKFKIIKDVGDLYTIAIETKQYLYKYCFKDNYYFSVTDDINVVYWENEDKIEEHFGKIIKDEINIIWVGE